MKIKTKLMSIFLIVSVIVIGAGIFSINQLKTLYTVSHEIGIKNSPLADAAMEIKLTATNAHLWFEEIITGTEGKEAIKDVWALLDETAWFCDAIVNGGKNAEGSFYPINDEAIEMKIQHLKKNLQKFKEVAQLRYDNNFGSKEIEDQGLDDQFDTLFKKFITEADEVEEMIHDKIAEEAVNMGNIANSGEKWLILMTLFSFIFVALPLFFVSRDILREVGGEPTDIARITEQVAEGNLELQLDDKKKATGIYASVKVMVQKLKKVNTEQEAENWLKTGQAELNKLVSGEQKISVLAKKIISFLSTYSNGQVGLFYLFKESEQEDKEPSLKLIASYAYTEFDSNKRPNRFSIGEGLVGQAALEQKNLVFTQDREDCPAIVRSGLADVQPCHVLIFPLLYEGNVKGVIEIGSSKSLNETQRNFLEQAMPNIAIAVNTTESRDRMQELLKQTQIQSIELKAKTEEMEKQQTILQQTNEELQTQSEELQTQQEELRQTNDELENRTSDLENQKNEIRQKNTILEKTQAEMKKAKQAIETKAKELELASKYKSEFLANMSHELRTPLNSLLILAQILSENRDGNLSEKQVGYTKTIHSAGSDLLRLINEILDLSKVEAGRIEINIESLTIGDLTEVIEQKFKPMADQKGVEFKVSTAKNFPGILRTDVHRLQQIINNLLSNAFKFTKEGSVTLSLCRPENPIENLELKKTDKILAISVSDTGIGIPKDKQQVIFEAFQQADGTTSRKFGGTGLGLSISRQLARLLGGDLVLESEENKGSTFTLYLPETEPASMSIKKPEPVELKAVPQIKKVEEMPENQTEIVEGGIVEEDDYEDDRANLQPYDKSILVIEDDRKFLDILVNLLRERDFKAIVAEDGTAGLFLAERYKPSAIILDIGLPKMDGWNVMERLKSNPKTRHIPVHFMSAADQKSQDARKMGAIGYLSKPVNVNELDQAFKNIEGFISKDAKQVLLVCDNEQRKHQILDLVATDDIKVSVATNQKEIYQRLKESKFDFDCVIVDISTEQDVCIGLVEQLAEKEALPLKIPVIVYTDRDLTHEEEVSLKRCEDSITIKSVRSPERLLDETTLFLHQLETNLPKEKQKMLRLVHDKEAILDGKKVMIVDDDVRNTFALMSFLEGKNMEVIVANHGKEALELLANKDNQDIALILMDIMMPELDGYETMRKIREQPQCRKLPIIALTAKAMKGDKCKCIDAGANDYVPKPVDTDKLLSLMRVWLYR